MASPSEPVSTLLEFLTWIAWWMVFLALQRRLYRRHPGLRTVCRMVFLWTLAVALVPAMWTLTFQTVRGPRLVTLFNHAFGMGVFAQTSLRSLILVRWLAWPGQEVPLSERELLASLVAARRNDAPAGSAADRGTPLLHRGVTGCGAGAGG
jgi:hypothetical protein